VLRAKTSAKVTVTLILMYRKPIIIKIETVLASCTPHPYKQKLSSKFFDYFLTYAANRQIDDAGQNRSSLAEVIKLIVQLPILSSTLFLYWDYH